MSIVNFSNEYYEAEKIFNECIDKLNAILDEDGKEILSSLLKAERIIFNEQVAQRFREGWYHGVNFTR